MCKLLTCERTFICSTLPSQFWSDSAAAGMESFRFQGVEALEDCDASIEMCKLVNELSDVMNSRLPQTALRPNSKQIEVQKNSYLIESPCCMQFLTEVKIFQVIDRFLAKLKSIQDYQTDKMRTIELKAEEARIKFMKQQGQKFRSRVADIKRRRMYVFSDSTDIGLKVTLENTKKLLEFLCTEQIGYKYLMTCRLNQDALEVS